MTGNVFPVWLVAWPNMWCPLSSLRRVLLVSSWRGPETNENFPNLRLLGLSLTSLLTTVFLQSACLGRVSTACSYAWLDPCCTVSWFTLSFHSRTTLLTPRTPLNGEGALVLRLRSRRIPSKVRWYVYIYIHTYMHTYIPSYWGLVINPSIGLHIPSMFGFPWRDVWSYPIHHMWPCRTHMVWWIKTLDHLVLRWGTSEGANNAHIWLCLNCLNIGYLPKLMLSWLLPNSKRQLFKRSHFQTHPQSVQEIDDLAALIATIDHIIGACFAGIWVISNATILTLFNRMYENWKDGGGDAS